VDPSLSASLPARALSGSPGVASNVVPLPGAGELTIVLAALAQPSRTSLYYLQLLTGLTGAVVDVCVARLEAAELVTSEHRSDGNELRRMVEITDAGRRALEDRDRPA
jgi:DNA-binding MarR family transcriptional regulator